jgi:PleD family two-component response regulator
MIIIYNLSIKKMISEADELLYEAKKNGKNQTIIN